MPSGKKLNFKRVPFSRLIVEAEDLVKIRQEYAAKSRKTRRMAADYVYHDACASFLFNQTIPASGMYHPDPWPGEVVALAIDPLFAPAMLTVGSYEYQYKRKKEAMKLFMALTDLPKDTVDIFIIIDKAGDFLIDNKDYKNALVLYSAAVQSFPDAAALCSGLSYCFAKIGKMDEAMTQARRAVELEPENYKHLSDLGWYLVEAMQYDEAAVVLEKAVSLSPPDYDMAQNNLQELRRLMKLKG